VMSMSRLVSMRATFEMHKALVPLEEAIIHHPKVSD